MPSELFFDAALRARWGRVATVLEAVAEGAATGGTGIGEAESTAATVAEGTLGGLMGAVA